jgi:hypothetical protein
VVNFGSGKPALVLLPLDTFFCDKEPGHNDLSAGKEAPMPKNIDTVFKLSILLICLNLTLAVLSCAGTAAARSKIVRVSAAETRTRVLQHEALLVCSYADDRCRKILFEGAILRSAFEDRLPTLTKNQEIIFYCA